MARKTIICSECGKKRPHQGNGLCAACYSRQRRKADPEEAKAQARRWEEQRGPRDRTDYMYQRRYGITLAQYNAMLKAQGNRCAICGKPPAKGRRLCVDHHHDSGEVRGLLCDDCNRAVGLMQDNPSLLRRALAYLAKK